MSDSIARILSCLADALMEGRIDQITPHFAYPLPVFLKDDLVVFGRPETVSEALCMYRSAVLAIGVVKLRPRVVAQGLPVRGYSNVWIEWDHLDRDGNILRTNQVRYAMCQFRNDLYPRVEMIDYTVTAFPELTETLPVARSA